MNFVNVTELESTEPGFSLTISATVKSKRNAKPFVPNYFSSAPFVALSRIQNAVALAKILVERYAVMEIAVNDTAAKCANAANALSPLTRSLEGIRGILKTNDGEEPVMEFANDASTLAMSVTRSVEAVSFDGQSLSVEASGMPFGKLLNELRGVHIEVVKRDERDTAAFTEQLRGLLDRQSGLLSAKQEEGLQYLNARIDCQSKADCLHLINTLFPTADVVNAKSVAVQKSEPKIGKASQSDVESTFNYCSDNVRKVLARSSRLVSNIHARLVDLYELQGKATMLNDQIQRRRGKNAIVFPLVNDTAAKLLKDITGVFPIQEDLLASALASHSALVRLSHTLRVCWEQFDGSPANMGGIGRGVGRETHKRGHAGQGGS